MSSVIVTTGDGGSVGALARTTDQSADRIVASGADVRSCNVISERGIWLNAKYTVAFGDSPGIT